MLTTTFKIYPFGAAAAQDVVINIDDEVYFVHVDGKYIGNMVTDLGADFGFSTEDKDLKPLIEMIAGHLQENDSRNEFPEIIKKEWGENIVSAEFTDEETIMVVCHPDTELDDFGSVVKDTIYDLVEFEEHLNVVLTKADSDEIFEIGLN